MQSSYSVGVWVLRNLPQKLGSKEKAEPGPLACCAHQAGAVKKLLLSSWVLEKKKTVMEVKEQAGTLCVSLILNASQTVASLTAPKVRQDDT